MAMTIPNALKRISRLFVIKTRWEAWAVTWAVAMGAVERGKNYLAVYPGALGWIFFALCCGVVFLAGAKLLDSTREQPAVAQARSLQHPPRRLRAVNNNRPRRFRPLAGSGPLSSRRKD